MFCQHYEKLVQTLEERGYRVHGAATPDDARQIVLTLVGRETSVGLGGSMTLSALGMYEALTQAGNAVYSHWVTPQAVDPDIYIKENSADWYLSSTNALTMDGKLINTDGTGNRLAGMFAGPKRVCLIVGKNKLVEDVQAGFARIKEVAAPQNAKRLHRATPCATDGKCQDCASPQRICRVSSIIEYKPGWLEELHLVLVDASLGY